MQRTVPILVFLLSLGAVAHAQAPATLFSELQTRLKVGETVMVTNDSGETVKGRVVQVSGTVLVLRGRAGDLHVAASDVQRIERPRDTFWNGALTGSAVGFGAGALLAATDDCSGPGIGPCFSDTEGVFYVGGIMGLMGLGVGVAVDAILHRERVVFVRTQSDSARVAIAPFLSPGRAGLLMQVGW
ncbi:MAG TPA: hypothetical protein VM818_21310 [Vicinamibacterales bacterium]|jgi:hypothetical protein|nr:hypothetical protein [Vicinamibacterales bacterium]